MWFGAAEEVRLRLAKALPGVQLGLQGRRVRGDRREVAIGSGREVDDICEPVTSARWRPSGAKATALTNAPHSLIAGQRQTVRSFPVSLSATAIGGACLVRASWMK